MANEGIESAAVEVQQNERLRILQHRTRILDATQTALGNRIASRDDVRFEGHVGGAQFSHIRLVHVPAERQKDNNGSTWKVQLKGYLASDQTKGPIIDTNGLTYAAVTLSLDNQNPLQDLLEIAPDIYGFADSPEGALHRATITGQKITQAEAERESDEMRTRLEREHAGDFAKTTSRTPTLNDYQVFDQVAGVIDTILRSYGPDYMQAMPEDDRNQDYGNPLGPLPPKDHS